MSLLMLDDYISRNPDTIVKINHERNNISGIDLTGILSDTEIAQTLTAQYGNSILNGSPEVASAFKAYGALGGKGSKTASVAGFGLDFAHRFATSKHTLMGTVQAYEGSGVISIPISATFFYNWGGNPGFKEMENQINKMTQPVTYPGGIMGSNLYSPSDLAALATKGHNLFDGKLLNVLIGGWFHATDVYITQVGKRYLTSTNEDGKPAAVQLQLNIEPYRQLTAEELTNWIL